MNLMNRTLTNRLRVAALSRAKNGGQVVGTHVIDGDGVVDLRCLEDRRPFDRASDLAPLSELVGRFDDVSDVGDLYAVGSERRWFGGRKARRQARTRTAQRTAGPGSVAPVPVDVRETDDDEIIEITEPLSVDL
jgi:hypothetical protein